MSEDVGELLNSIQAVIRYCHVDDDGCVNVKLEFLEQIEEALQGSTANNGNIITPRTLQLLEYAYKKLRWVELKEELERLSALQGSTAQRDTVTVSRECAERAIKNAKVERENSEAAADESLAYRDKASVEHLGHGETKKIGLWLHNLHLILFWFCFSIVILTLI